MVPVGGVGAVDDDGAQQALAVLDGVVRVVPAGPVLGRLPLVGVAVSGSDGTLGLRGGAVGIVGVELADVVPVDAGAVVGKVVADFDLDVVTQLASRRGPGYWPLTVISRFSTPSGARVVYPTSKLYCSWLVSASDLE